MLPDSWEPYGPEVDMGPAGPLFGAICLALWVLHTWTWCHVRPALLAAAPIRPDAG